MMKSIVVNIPHEELQEPPLRARIDLREADLGQRLVVEFDADFASEHKLCDYLEGGYALAANGQLFDASSGPLSVVQRFGGAIERRMADICDRKSKSASLVMKGGEKPSTKLNRDEMFELLGG